MDAAVARERGRVGEQAAALGMLTLVWLLAVVHARVDRQGAPLRVLIFA